MKSDIVYFADQKNYPYGTKSQAQMASIIKKTISMLEEKFTPDIIVVASNTPSLMLNLQKGKIIDVKPPLKLAKQKTKSKKIGILATKSSVNSKGLENYVKENKIPKSYEIFKINVRAPFIFSKEFSKDMKKSKWGRIVNIGSSSAYNGFKNSIAYCSSKHALLGFSRALFSELKENNVRVYSISPGSTQTKMGKLSKDQKFETFLKPEEIAEYVEFVISFDKQLVSEEIRLNRIKYE